MILKASGERAKDSSGVASILLYESALSVLDNLGNKMASVLMCNITRYPPCSGHIKEKTPSCKIKIHFVGNQVFSKSRNLALGEFFIVGTFSPAFFVFVYKGYIPNVHCASYKFVLK